MKTIQIKNAVVTLLCTVVVAGFTACTTDTVERNGGKLPDEDPLENTYGMLRSVKSSGRVARVNLSEGSGFTTDKIYYQITAPAGQALSLDAWVDVAKVSEYNKTYGDSCVLLPEVNYEFIDGKTLVIDKNGKRSAPKRVKFFADNLTPGAYVLPVTVAKAGDTAEKMTMYYRIGVRARQMGDYELNKDQLLAVFYINTSQYDPRLVDDYFMRKESTETWEEVWYRTVGDIINLRTVTLDFDSNTRRALLSLSSDMRYVLDHADKYIRPLQDKGRKVCLAIEGGGKGVGFCNLTDAQIADFVAQVKVVVETNELDGVNLWDRNSGYGQDGAPAMNTTSYPKLIVALHDMLKALGSDKLLSVTDHLEPTEYFWDTTATGGIEVGAYLDYAWSGYRTTDEKIEVFDPWHPGAMSDEGVEIVSGDVHKPFAGLDPAKYGCINVPWYSGNTEFTTETLMLDIFRWRQAGYKQSSIVAFEDLRTNLQDRFEGGWGESMGNAYRLFCDDGVTEFYEDEWGGWAEEDNFYSFDGSKLSELEGRNGYNKWLKDW